MKAERGEIRAASGAHPGSGRRVRLKGFRPRPAVDSLRRVRALCDNLTHGGSRCLKGTPEGDEEDFGKVSTRPYEVHGSRSGPGQREGHAVLTRDSRVVHQSLRRDNEKVGAPACRIGGHCLDDLTFEKSVFDGDAVAVEEVRAEIEVTEEQQDEIRKAAEAASSPACMRV